MKFTFGIITSPESHVYLQQVVDSISEQNIPSDSFEIVVVGGSEAHQDDNMTVIPFDHSKRRLWITRQKNVITEHAKYENVVYLHDYVSILPGWYEGFQEFGNGFDICMTPIFNADGGRYRDWTIWIADDDPDCQNRNRLLPYDITTLSQFMYISGAYWIAKRDVMQKFPLDERLSWGESEDVLWSRQVREHYQFSINVNSGVRLLKQKDRVFNEITPEKLKQLTDLL
jgi:hypothetical protein